MIERLRAAALIFGILLIGTAIWLEFSSTRPLILMLDDFVIGGSLIGASVVIYKDSTRRRALMSAAWALAVGKLYSSLMTRLFTPSDVEGAMFVILLIGLATLVALAGLVATIIMPRVR